MSFQQSASGKAQIISVDSREVVHNPLYKAFKTKNFSDYDILLHFCILDMLAGGKELAFRNIAGELQEYGFSGEENVINERTIRLKLQEYEKLGILNVRTEGKKKQYYSLSADAVDLVSWQDAIEFFSETEPEPIYKQLFEQPQTEGEEHFIYPIIYASSGTFAVSYTHLTLPTTSRV